MVISIMESFAVNHAGRLAITHTLDLTPATVEAFRELQKLAGIVVLGWVTVTVIKSITSTSRPPN